MTNTIQTPAPTEPGTIRLRGTGGAILEYEIPKLDEYLVQQIEQGRLQPVDANSAKLLADAGLKVGG